MKKLALLLVLICIVNLPITAQLSKDYQQIVSECVSKSNYQGAEKALLMWIDEVGQEYTKLDMLYTNLGTIQRRSGKNDLAMQSYNKAYELNKESTRALSNRASLKRQMGDLEGSLADYNEAIQLEMHEDLLSNRAYTYKMIGDTLAAETDLLKVLEINPDNFRAMTNLMNIKVARGAFEEAIAFYNKAIFDHPGEPLLYNNRADVLLKMKDYENAIIDANKAIKMEKSYDNAYVTRAEIYIAIGERKKALKDLQKAVKLGNDSNYVMSLIDECNRY